MSDERQIDLVSAALVEAQGKLKAAEMDAQNPFFKSKYATLGAIIEASRDALYNAGLMIQQPTDIHEGMVTVRTIIRHKSGQWIDGGTMSLAIGENDRNSDAQLAGSICTYLKRYSWASNLGIYADQDTDGNDAPKGAVKAPTATAKASEVKVGPKYRMEILNRLKGAPGQPNENLLADYLRSKGWITGDQKTVDFPLNQLPESGEDFTELTDAIQRFEVSRREQEVQP
jgi:hypothetical protein